MTSNAVIAPHSWRYGTTGALVRRPVDDAHLEDANALTAALDALLKAKPHLASRRPRGDVGQGQSGGAGTFDLAGMLWQRAG